MVIFTYNTIHQKIRGDQPSNSIPYRKVLVAQKIKDG